jgi:hypothetical protein
MLRTPGVALAARRHDDTDPQGARGEPAVGVTPRAYGVLNSETGKRDTASRSLCNNTVVG